MKFLTSWRGAKTGEIYPTEFAPGDDCPQELESAAIAEGVVSIDGKTEPEPRRTRKAKS